MAQTKIEKLREASLSRGANGIIGISRQAIKDVKL